MFHIMYETDKVDFKSIYKDFDSYSNAEKWLNKIKAKYWEIGFN